MEKKIFRIQADFFIEAKDKDEAERIIADDSDFIEAHVLISPATKDEIKNIEEGYDEIYNKEDRENEILGIE